MSRDLKAEKQAWIDDAKATPWDTAASHLPTRFKHSGTSRTSIDGCPYCGGKDRLSYDIGKGAWICRGATAGYNPVGMIEHCLNVSFQEACEILTGRPNPYGETQALSEDEKRQRQADRDRRLEEARHAQEKAEEDAAQRDKRNFELACRIWEESQPISGTPGELYFNKRGTFRSKWSDQIRFHKGITYFADPEKPVYPAVIARVSDMFGDMLGIWRIYITEEGNKAPVPSDPGCKIGLGRTEGGAVYLHGIDQSRGVMAEGLETTLAAEDLFGLPGIASLSTSGMIGIDPPLDLEALLIASDGDLWKYQEASGKWLEPQGQKAARKSYERLSQEHGIDVTGPYEPAPGMDWEDVRNLTQDRRAA